MKKIASFLTKKKIWVIVFFVIAMAASAFCISKVKINYDISKYLDAESETSQALRITEDEFGLNGNMQVMVSDINKDEASKLKDDMEDINYVLSVSFDVSDANYYHDDKALYIVLIDGDDYSQNAKSVSEDIKNLLIDYHVSYGGTAIDKQRLQDSIESEMVLIATVATSLAAAILLLTSESWFEPLILLGVAGVAILINLGTNIMFSSISYITKSISSVLQLALSIDYSIVLLHTYRKNKGEISNQEAMSKAIVEVIKPIGASGLTTLAGLCALLFMSYRIGFDIGIVLMKGILISLITSITLLPAIILLLDKLLVKTKKKSIKFSGKMFTSVASKGSKFIVPLSLVLIAVCGTLNFRNTYTYSNQSNVDPVISENFNQRNQFMVVFPNESSSYDNQENFINEIKEYKTVNGDNPFVSYTSITNTVLERYDAAKIEKQLEVSSNEADLMMSLMLLSNDPSKVTMSFDELVSYSSYLVDNDSDVKEFADESSVDTIKILSAIEEVLNNENSASEFVSYFKNEPLSKLDANIELDSLKQIYGLYFYSSLENSNVKFSTMLDYLTYISSNVPAFSSKVDEATLSKLTLIDSEVNNSISQAETPLTKDSLRGYLYQTYQIVLSEEDATKIFASYYLSKGEEVQETIPLLPLMSYMVETGMITNEDQVAQINQAKYQYQLVTSSYPYSSFLTILEGIIKANTGEEVSIPLSNEEMQMVYISYFNQTQAFDSYKLSGSKLVTFVKSLYENSSLMKEEIGEDLYKRISDLATIDSYFKDETKLDYKKQYESLVKLRDSLTSNAISTNLDVDMIQGVYTKKASSDKVFASSTVIAEDLLNFIDSNKESNSLLKKKLSQDNLNKLDKAKNSMDTAKGLFSGGKYSRLLITMDLSNEGEDTESFISYLKEKSTKYFGSDSYIAGESVSTNDLKTSFKTDEIIISLVTIISILLITAFTFKSASLPVILVLIIQGACWIAFSTNAITGPVFFMSYIIASCILMGATVDYGILMSTNYLANRKTMEKKEALQNAIKSSLPTIFTSGLILTVCGGVIYFLSSQASISSVGLLVCKGTIAAILLILFVLPSFLYLLDKFILKTTYHKKKKDQVVEQSESIE